MKREVRLTNFLFGVAQLWTACILLAHFTGWNIPSFQYGFGFAIWIVAAIINIGAALLSE